MIEQTTELRLAEPIAAVFAALAQVASIGRWDAMLDESQASAVPRRGCRYSGRRRGRVCRGQVVECLRPVSLILNESLERAPSLVEVRWKWRIEPVSKCTLLTQEVRAELNRAASFKRRNWERKLESDGRQLFLQLGARLSSAQCQPAAGKTGQTTGNNSIVSAKITSVRGKPSFR
jgi:hypothetical protein